MEKMKGVVVPVVTPFTKDDKVDTEVLSNLVDYLVKNDVDSVYPNGTTGEMLKMNAEERKLVAETCIKASNGRIPVFVQTGAPTTSETIELSKHALEIGAKGIGVVTPQFFGVNRREMVNYYVTVSKALPDDFPVYLYNIPQCSGNDINADVVDEILSQTKNVVGMKYSGADFIKFNQYLMCGDRTLEVMVGPDRLFLEGLVIGCSGVISGCAQCFPEPFVNVWKKWQKGDVEGAREEQVWATRLAETVKAGANMGYLKAAMEHNGLGVSHMRAPAMDITREEKEALFNALDTLLSQYKERNK